MYIDKAKQSDKESFLCSLCHKGVLGGALIVDRSIVQYKTGKVTIEEKYRNLVLNRADICSVTWKWAVFPKATFEMKNGEKFSFLIFNKWRFMRVFNKNDGQNEIHKDNERRY